MSLPQNISIPVGVTIQAAAGDTPRTFTVDAYQGGELLLKGFALPIVVDLASLQIAERVLANLDHNAGQRVGHVTEHQNDGRKLRLSGVVSAASAAATEFTTAADHNFPWQASIEAKPVGKAKLEQVRPGQTVSVNGQTFKGPILVARDWTLDGIAFLSKGADTATRVMLATGVKNLEPSYIITDATIQAQAETDPVAAERARIKAIERSCAGDDWGTSAARVSDLRAQAIDGDLSLDTLRGELVTIIRAERPKGPQIHSSPRDMTGDVIEAALCQAIGMPKLDQHFTDQVLQAAHSAFRGRIGLQQSLIMAACGNGLEFQQGERIHAGNLRRVLAYALPGEGPHIHAASTHSLSGILSNVANKNLLAGWMEGDQTWKKIAITKPVSDFKQATSYRMLDNMEYEELGVNGTIAHGQLGEESYTRQAKTYAKMFGLTRVDIVNDDLGAFNDLRLRLGMGALRKFNNLLWAKFMDNAAFFTAARGNYITGGTTTLLTDGVGLQLAEVAFKTTLKTADGKRVDGEPVIVLHPPELAVNARKIYQSTNFSGGSAAAADANAFERLYEPVSQQRLSDSAFTGSSATAWYLLRNPAIAAAVVVSFLNGVETPTVEQAEAAFDTLGVDFRGFHDFGVDQAEWLAGVKSKGAA